MGRRDRARADQGEYRRPQHDRGPGLVAIGHLGDRAGREVERGGGQADAGADPGPQLGGCQHRNREEGVGQHRRRPAHRFEPGHDGECGDSGQIDQQRQPGVPDHPDVAGDEPGQPGENDRPAQVADPEGHRQIALGRRGQHHHCDQHQGGQGEPDRRLQADAPPSLPHQQRSQPGMRGDGTQRSDRLRAHSSSPRRIASATAAARSETPSFSYNRCVCVLTVLGARKSSAAS